MASELLHLCLIYPIIESLVSNLSQFELRNLSRTSPDFWAALHGIDFIEFREKGRLIEGTRSSLRVFDSNTEHWLNLCNKCTRECGEKDCQSTAPRAHWFASGPDLQPCRICSRPICFDCHRKFRNSHTNLGTIYYYHYQLLCVRCYPDNYIVFISRHLYKILYRKPVPLSKKCRCSWSLNNEIRVCSGCRQGMWDKCERMLLVNPAGQFPSPHPSPHGQLGCKCGCGLPLRSWKRPWGRRYHVVCELCGLPSRRETSLARYEPRRIREIKYCIDVAL